LYAEIIAIGSELLTPVRQDTNSLFLTERLNQLAVQVRFKNVVGDRTEDLTAVARAAIARCEIVIFMGGLGPTEDDLTRECVAAALGIELKRDPDWIAELYRRFAARRIKLSPNNEKQADLLAGAELLPNPRGTAPGQWLATQHDGAPRWIMLLPGPPHELKPMFDEQCMERLRAAVPPAFLATVQLKMVMIGEGECDARAAPIYREYADVETTILASAGEVQLHFRKRAPTLKEAEARVAELADAVEDELGDIVFTRGEETLEQIVGYWCQLRSATLAVAESCTGGLLAERVTSVSGSSRYFLGGAVVYANEMKTAFAGVAPELIAKHGSVSAEVAKALAEGIRERCGATLGIGITGIAGPTGGTEEKPVGMVFHALADGRTTEVVQRRFPGDRGRIRLLASQMALDMVRRKLM
jgi:nicotinamide-nucleotide amidase